MEKDVMLLIRIERLALIFFSKHTVFHFTRKKVMKQMKRLGLVFAFTSSPIGEFSLEFCNGTGTKAEKKHK
jgi:hypothetical protein